MGEGFSLNIRPLWELVNMYHDRDATDRRDKIFALMGMSSSVPDDLSTSYYARWSRVFGSLVRSIFGVKSLISTWDDQEIAVIMTKFNVLGEVVRVPYKDLSDARQPIVVGVGGFQDHLTWSVLPSAVPVCKGVIVCILHYTSQPVVLRPFDDLKYGAYCAVVGLTTAPMELSHSNGKEQTWINSMRRGHSPIEFQVLWDWGLSKGENGQGRTEIHREVIARTPVGARPCTFEAVTSGLEGYRSLMAHLGKVDKDRAVLETLLVKYDDALYLHSDLPQVKSLKERMAKISREMFILHHYSEMSLSWSAEIEWIADVIGSKGDITERHLLDAVGTGSSASLETLYRYKEEKLTAIISTQAAIEALVSRSRTDGMIELVLGWIPDEAAAALNVNAIVKARLTYSLTRSNGNVLGCFLVLVSKFGDRGLLSSEDLIRWIADQLTTGDIVYIYIYQLGEFLDTCKEWVSKEVKQEVLKAMAYSRYMVDIYLDHWGGEVVITEEVMVILVVGITDTYETDWLVWLILHHKVPVTEKILKAAVANTRLGRRVLKSFQDEIEDEVLLTQEMRNRCKELELAIPS